MDGGRLNIDIPNAQDYFWIRVFLKKGCFYRKQILRNQIGERGVGGGGRGGGRGGGSLD